MQLLPMETIVLETKPSRKVVGVWLFTKAFPAALWAAMCAAPVWFIFINPSPRGAPPPHPQSIGFLFVGVVFLAVWLTAHVYNLFLARSYAYQVTSHRFIFTGGIIRRTTHAVEHRRVTDVQFSQNLAEQALSLSSVNLSTPGTVNGGPNAKNRSMPELRLEGLTDGEKVFEVISTCVRESHGPAV